MRNLVATRRGSAALVAISLFLPLGQCAVAHRTGTPVSGPEVFDVSAFDLYKWPGLGGALAILLFLWPVIFELARLLDRRKQRLVVASAIALCLASLTWVTYLVMLCRTIRWGAFVAYASLLTYGFASVASSRARRQGSAGGDPAPDQAPE